MLRLTDLGDLSVSIGAVSDFVSSGGLGKRLCREEVYASCTKDCHVDLHKRLSHKRMAEVAKQMRLDSISAIESVMSEDLEGFRVR